MKAPPNQAGAYKPPVAGMGGRPQLGGYILVAIVFLASLANYFCCIVMSFFVRTGGARRVLMCSNDF